MALTQETLNKFLAKAATVAPRSVEVFNFLTFEEILKHRDFPAWAVWYTCIFLGYRWYEAEEYIRKNQEWAYWYARYVIKGPWKEAEDTIKQDAYWWAEYKKVFKIKKIA